MSENITESQTFLKTQQLLLFIHSVSMDVVQSRFPGRNTLQSLFELILVSINFRNQFDRILIVSPFFLNLVHQSSVP